MTEKEQIMQIGNPIYDVAFKFMMEDLKVAKLMLVALTELDIIELAFEPQEFTKVTPNQKDKIQSHEDKKSLFNGFNINTFRLDFKAKIKTKDGKTQLIIFEIQKAKIFTTPIRFRNYLGRQYSNNQLYYNESVDNKKYKAGIPIKSIYFLGELFHSSMSDVPVINVNLEMTNQETGERIVLNDPFINSLYHTGIIVNIPALKEEARNELTALLNIFNQANMTQNDHILEVDETAIPEKYHPILSRLAMIAGDDIMLQKMEVEDSFLAEIDQILDAVEEQRTLKEEALSRIENERRQKEEAMSQKEEAINMTRIMIKSFLDKGVDKEYICETLSMSLPELEELLK